MATLTFLPAARRDLLDLWVTIARENQRAADRALDRIEAACNRLRSHPFLGPARPQIGEDARVLIVKRWLVLYQVSASSIRIIRVIDGARDLDQLLWELDRP